MLELLSRTKIFAARMWRGRQLSIDIRCPRRPSSAANPPAAAAAVDRRDRRPDMRPFYDAYAYCADREINGKLWHRDSAPGTGREGWTERKREGCEGEVGKGGVSVEGRPPPPSLLLRTLFSLLSTMFFSGHS